MLQRGASNLPVFGTRLLPLAYHGLSPLPSSFTNSCSGPTPPPWQTVISCTGTLTLSLSGLLNTQQKPLPSLSTLCSLFRFYSQERRGVCPADTWSGAGLLWSGRMKKYKIPGLESIWFTQSCHMTPCYLPQCSLGRAISEKKRLTCVFRRRLFR